MECIKLDHSIVVAAISQWRRRLSTYVRAHGRHFEHFVCVSWFNVLINLRLRIFEFVVLLFEYFIYRQNVICLKRFTGYGHYAGEVEDVMMGRLAVVS